MPNHALLSPSSAARWLACPASAHLNALLPEQSSEAADRGTVMHGVAEQYLRKNLLNDTAAVPCFDALTDKEVQLVTAYVAEVTRRFLEKTNPRLFIESKFDMSRWCPSCFGTGDAVIIADGIIEVIDFKSGTGVRVEVDGNPQLRLYALGAYDAFGALYKANTIRTTIVQPGLDHIQSCDIDIEELLAWGDFVKKAANDAFNGKKAYHIGSHCRFCKAIPVCPAQGKRLMEIGKSMMVASTTRKKSVDRMTRSDIARALTATLPALRAMKTYCTKAEGLTEALIEDGTPVHGYEIGKRGLKMDSAGLDFADLNKD